MEEVAYLAYHFHWSHDRIMAMEHRERQEWVRQVAQINQRLNDQTYQKPSQSYPL